MMFHSLSIGTRGSYTARFQDDVKSAKCRFLWLRLRMKFGGSYGSKSSDAMHLSALQVRNSTWPLDVKPWA